MCDVSVKLVCSKLNLCVLDHAILICIIIQQVKRVMQVKSTLTKSRNLTRIIVHLLSCILSEDA